MVSTRITEYVDALVASERFGPLVAGRRLTPAKQALLLDPPAVLSPAIRSLLGQLGINKLFSHQCEAFLALRNGYHTVVATPTASGKSLIYNLSLFDLLERDSQARALYLFPLKALTQDQLKTFEQWRRFAPFGVDANVYDGDTSAYQRKKIRSKPPTVIMTNPDMIHLSMLAHHHQWQSFFSNLKLIVIDEVHTYRGMIGAHMAQVLRRLQRICSHYGTNPVYVMTSATVANPGWLAEQLSGVKPREVLVSGAGQGRRHMIIIDPDTSPAQSAILLLKAAIARNLRTIVYTKSRRQAELITLWAGSQSAHISNRISVYRAGLTPEERRDIENRLERGDLLAVVSTSALELGIDIGDLDLCILVGYPGSMMATLQRAGRVGRKGQDSALILIAAEDGLDQYFVAHPTAFWSGKPERAVLNPYNETVLNAHLVCAAAELPFTADDPWLTDPQVAAAAVHLEESGDLMKSADGRRVYSRRKKPHRLVRLRGEGRTYPIIDADSQRVIGDVDAFRVYRETYPGAVYLHKTRTYLVVAIEEHRHCVMARKASLSYYTRVRSDSDISINQLIDYKYIGNTRTCYGKLKVTEKVTGFERVNTANGVVLERVDLDLPPVMYFTEGMWFEIPPAVGKTVADAGFDLVGSLHAAEHATISMMPLMLLVDRSDIGGLATALHPDVGMACVFIYDGVPGGAGLTRQAFEQVSPLLRKTIDSIDRCKCEQGCPACVHSPKCGSLNRPLDKHGAVRLVEALLCDREPAKILQKVQPNGTCAAAEKAISATDPFFTNQFGVFDLETQYSAQEVGGWHKAHLMKISCGVVYDAAIDSFEVYLEDQVTELVARLHAFKLVVGFNSRRFDYQVLSGYSDFNFDNLPTLDLLEMVRSRLGYRLSLDHLARHTLNAAKSGSGLDALQWWKEGRIDRLVAYCRMDVGLTRDLFLFARQNGYLIYQDKTGRGLRIPLPELLRAPTN